MSIYDVFKDGHSSSSFDKEAWVAQKQEQRKAAYELIDNTCTEMSADGNQFKQYLNVQAEFDRYSVANAVLVSAQLPEATQLKEYKKWKENRVYVNKDADKITILEPGKEYTREDGTTATSFNAKDVYDISQTSARVKTSDAKPKSMRDLVSALIDASPVPIQPVDSMEVPAFYDSSQEIIFVRTDLSEGQLFASTSKEVAAAIYDFKHNKSREDTDFKSYCVAYMLGSKYGVDTKGFSFDKLPEQITGLDPKDLRSELGSIRDVFGEVNSEMYKGLEKNTPVRSKEQER